jgi:hypothetical protein
MIDDSRAPARIVREMDSSVTHVMLRLGQHSYLGQFAMRFRSSGRNSIV